MNLQQLVAHHWQNPAAGMRKDGNFTLGAAGATGGAL